MGGERILRYGRVEKNGALKEENNGWNRWVGLDFWNYRSHSISSTRKTYKDFETKGNSRRGLQRRVMHQTNLLNHGGVEQNRELNREIRRQLMKKLLYKITLTLSLVGALPIVAHESGGKESIQCTVSYSSFIEKDIYGIREKEGGKTLYAISLRPLPSISFINDHFDVPVMDESLGVMNNAFHIPVVAETMNGITISGTYMVLNYDDPPSAQHHPSNNMFNITNSTLTKKDFDRAETRLKHCYIIF